MRLRMRRPGASTMPIEGLSERDQARLNSLLASLETPGVAVTVRPGVEPPAIPAPTPKSIKGRRRNGTV